MWAHKHFSNLFYHNLLTICTILKMFTTNVKFNGHSSDVYRSGIATNFGTKNISLSVNCAHVVDFCRPQLHF